MTRPRWLAVVGLSVAVTRVDGHQLDELLQSTKLDVSSQRVSVALTLSPGTAVAAELIRELDGDRDARLSPEELRQFGLIVMRDLALTVDGRPAAITLVRAESSSIEELGDGMGALRLQFVAAGPLPPGQHRVRYQNVHASDGSVYLANALEPTDRTVEIGRQRRDYFQRSLELEVAVAPPHQRAAGGVMLAAAVALLVVTRGRRRLRVLKPLRSLR